jgi:hypothetical protein
MDDEYSLEELGKMSDISNLFVKGLQPINGINTSMYMGCANGNGIVPERCCDGTNNEVVCYYETEGNFSSNAVELYCLAEERLRVLSVPNEIEILFGINDGELFQYPTESANCSTNIDPRFTQWFYQGITGPREIVILLDLSMNNNNELRRAAINIINTLSPKDKVGFVLIVASRQRICPEQLRSATDNEKQELIKLITEEIVTENRNHDAAFAAVSNYFSGDPGSAKRFFILLTSSGNEAYNMINYPSVDGIMNLTFSANDAIQSLTFANTEVATYPIDELAEQLVSSQSFVIPENIFMTTDQNTRGELSLLLTGAWVRNSELQGVISVMLPWKRLLMVYEVACNRRPSCYYFALQQNNGTMMYHSRFPNTNLISVDPNLIERNEVFPMVLQTVQRGDNDSFMFENTILLPASNQSYYTKKVESTYHCRKVVENTVFHIFICLVLADEDASYIEEFDDDATDGYSSSELPIPLYQTNLATSSAKCDFLCRYSSNETLTLQMTTPNAPPNPGVLSSFLSYISGMNQTTPFWVEDGTASEIALHARVSTIWLNRDLSSQYPTMKKYIASPTGVFLSYPGIYINSSFNPRGLPWYYNALSHPGLLALSLGRPDNLYPNLAPLFTVSYAVRIRVNDSNINSGRGLFVGVVAADLTQDSLRASIYSTGLGRQCENGTVECSVLSIDGYFILPPPGASNVHITQVQNYGGIASSMINNSILVKQGCNDIINIDINYKLFYSIKLNSTSAVCYSPLSQSLNYCIQQIRGTNSYFLTATSKPNAGPAFVFCSPDCLNSFNPLSAVCPCSSIKATCSVPSYLDFFACPMDLPPANYEPLTDDNSTDPSPSDDCFTNLCVTYDEFQCNSSITCNWCEDSNRCISIENCCDGSTSCCDSLPTCLRTQCSMIPPTQDPTITAAVIGGVVGLILILTLIVLFGGCCIWYQFCRVKEPEETKPGVFDINEYKASNPSAIDIDNKDNTHL